MAEVRWTQQAADDLEAITEFIALDSPHYAALFVSDIFQTLERVETFPDCGRVVPETNDASLREIIMGSYRLVYRIQSDVAEILTVYHCARLFDPSQL